MGYVPVRAPPAAPAGGRAVGPTIVSVCPDRVIATLFAPASVTAPTSVLRLVTPAVAARLMAGVRAYGSPETLLMTDAKERTGWSLVNSRKRFVSVSETGGANSVEKRLICLKPDGPLPSANVAPETSVPSPFRRFALTVAAAVSLGLKKTTLVREPETRSVEAASWRSVPCVTASATSIPGIHCPCTAPVWLHPFTLLVAEETKEAVWKRIGPYAPGGCPKSVARMLSKATWPPAGIVTALAVIVSAERPAASLAWR